MRFLAIAFVVACASETWPGPNYPLHPRMRAASGGPIELVGQVAHPGMIPYSRGLTLTTALRLAGGPTGRVNGAMLRRGSRLFGLPLAQIVNHEAPDLELAPGDIVIVEDNEKD